MLGGAVPAESRERDLDSRRPRKTVLVLGGGGMRGFCHIGVVRAIERLGLVIDEVVGTSMGAVMGGMFAAGLDSKAMEEAAAEISLKDYFRLNLLKFLVRGYRHASVYKGRTFHDLLRKWLPFGSFADLQRPFFCNALSLTTGASRFFGLPGADQVAVADAVYASACLPTIFEPLALGGDQYVDGGMTETLALRIARARHADLVIGIDLSRTVVGADREGISGSQAGAAYVFNRVGALWSQTTKLMASDSAVGDQFGYSVDIAGRMVVGAHLDDDRGNNAGAAYVFGP
jgi:NTE family protein